MKAQAVLERRRARHQELLGLAQGFVAEIERRLPVRAAVVFGSVARGDFNLWSDVDLLVIVDAIGGNPLERSDALGPRRPKVQPVAWRPEEWRTQLARANPIARESHDRGVWLRGSPEEL
jgi:uncharacterized protein